MRLTLTLTHLTIASMLLAGCDTTLESDPDVLVSDLGLDTVVAPDQGGGADLPPADAQGADQLVPEAALRVGAIQLDRDGYKDWEPCSTSSDVTCTVQHYVKEASKQGAELILVPDYAFYPSNGTGYTQLAPKVGDALLTTTPSASILHIMAQLAVDESVILVFPVITQDGTGTSAKMYDTMLAIDNTGKVLAKHDKLQLYGTETSLTEGSSVTDSCFDTRAGKACMLVGMDAGCIVKDMQTGNSCTQNAATLLGDLKAEQPDIVLFSVYWENAWPTNPPWQILNVMQKTATTFNAWVVGANTTASPGQGGGIWMPSGTPYTTSSANTANVQYGSIPDKTP